MTIVSQKQTFWATYGTGTENAVLQYNYLPQLGFSDWNEGPHHFMW